MYTWITVATMVPAFLKEVDYEQDYEQSLVPQHQTMVNIVNIHDHMP